MYICIYIYTYKFWPCLQHTCHFTPPPPRAVDPSPSLPLLLARSCSHLLTLARSRWQSCACVWWEREGKRERELAHTATARAHWIIVLSLSLSPSLSLSLSLPLSLSRLLSLALALALAFALALALTLSLLLSLSLNTECRALLRIFWSRFRIYWAVLRNIWLFCGLTSRNWDERRRYNRTTPVHFAAASDKRPAFTCISETEKRPTYIWNET